MTPTPVRILSPQEAFELAKKYHRPEHGPFLNPGPLFVDLSTENPEQRETREHSSQMIENLINNLHRLQDPNLLFEDK